MQLPQLRISQAVSVRRFNPELDHADVVHICRNVYGGMDDLPNTIIDASKQAGTHILVACTGGQETPQLDAILCCQQRGDVLWLWGARTREEARGRGLAQLLLEEAEVLARSLPGVAALLSVTVFANDIMLRLFQRRGFKQQCQIVSWPATEASLAAHRQLQELRQQQSGGSESVQLAEQEEGTAQQQLSMLSILPKVAAIVDSPTARQLLPHWQRCRSQHDLIAALVQLRQERSFSEHAHQEEAKQQQGHQPDAAGTCSAAEAAQNTALLPADSQAFAWLPAEYELLPGIHSNVPQLIADGRVWLLQADLSPAYPSILCEAHDSGSALKQPAATITAVLVLWGAGFRGIHHAGIVAGCAAALDSALLHAASADAACCRFYVDCCGQFEREELWSSTSGQRYDILPHYKQLQ